MNDTPKGWVAPFGHPGIKACSRLLRDFRSVPRPSSPLGAKASTRCPSYAQTQCIVSLRRQRPPCTGAINASTPKRPPAINQSGNTKDVAFMRAHVIFHAPELCNHRHARPASAKANAEPGQTTRITASRTSRTKPQTKPAKADPARSLPSCPARPGARQNLIHVSKDHLRRRMRQVLPNGSNPAQQRQTQHTFRDFMSIASL